MNNTTKCNQDDVDIYGALIILWKNKLTVFLCIFIAVLFGTMLFFLKEPIYESKIYISKDVNSDLYSSKKSLEVLKEVLFKRRFEGWKKNTDTMIVFEDFSKEKIINGNLLNTDNRKSITFIHKNVKVNHSLTLSLIHFLKSMNILTMQTT